MEMGQRGMSHWFAHLTIAWTSAAERMSGAR